MIYRFFLKKNPEYFSNEMLKELKIKMEYKDLDNLSFLLNKEFEKCEKFKDCKNFENWVKNSIGTVRKFQGKEADSVILLLGCDNDSKASVNWAKNQSNILNVAVTRAKYRFSIIGDIDLWADSGFYEIAKNILKEKGEGDNTHN